MAKGILNPNHYRVVRRGALWAYRLLLAGGWGLAAYGLCVANDLQKEVTATQAVAVEIYELLKDTNGYLEACVATLDAPRNDLEGGDL